MNADIQDDWYESFFSGLNCEMWEKAVSAEWTEREAVFIVDVLNCPPGADVLDIPCGYGRHAIALAKRGFHLTGIDLSREFIQTFRKSATQERLPVRIIEGNLLTVEIGQSFDGAYCLGNSFGYFPIEDMNSFVGKVASVLKPGARFVINSGLVAESILPNFPKTKQYVLGNLIMDIRNSYVIGESCMATEITYTKAGHVETHWFKHYVHTLAEIKRLLKRHGLQTIAVYSSTEKQAYQLGDQQMYLVAEKQQF